MSTAASSSSQSDGGKGGDSAVELPTHGRRILWTWSFLIAVGGFLFGFDTGVISGALLFLKDDFDLNSFEQGTVVSVLLLGAMAGALGSGRIADPLGRRKIFALEGVVFLIGTALAVFANGYPMLLLSRIVLGLAVGAASATVPTYLGEIAPAQIRGRVLTLNQLMITIGIMSAYIVNVAFSGSENWRGMFAVGAVPALVIIIGALFVIPESPAWLLTNGKVDDVTKVYSRIVGDDQAKELVKERQQEREDERAKQGGQDQQVGWRGLTAASVRPALIVGVMLAAIQQFGGINTIIYYAPSIMEKTGLTASNSVYYSVAIGIINLVMTVVALFLVGRLGRRTLLLFSMGSMFVTLVLMGISFTADWNSSISLAFMVLYIASFAIGMGPLFWVMIGEIFPPHASATGSSAATAVNWTANFAVSLVFLSVVNAIGLGETFWVFAAICAFAVWFIGKYVPETKDRTHPEINADLQARFGHDHEQVASSR